MKYCIIFVFLFSFISTEAQLVDKDKNLTDSISQTKLTGETWFEQKGYKGEQFFNKTWMLSDIILTTGETVYGVEVKYNGFLDELIWVNPTLNQQFKLDKQLIKEFSLKTKQGQLTHFKRLKIIKPGSTNRQSDLFAEVEVEGKISIYIQRKISVVNTDYITIDGIPSQEEIIKPTPQYFLKFLSSDFMQLEKIKLKLLMQLLPTQKQQIDLVMRKNNLKLKTEQDLVKLIKLLNAQE
jgi:hypothetical protein